MNTAKIENKNLPAFACVAYDERGGGYHQDGLTKREYIATNIMQGLCASNDTDAFGDMKSVAEQAVIAADALLESLNK